MSARRAEIEAKRAKLVELRKAREERAKQSREKLVEGDVHEHFGVSKREELDAFLASLLPSKEKELADGAAAGTAEAGSAVGIAEAGNAPKTAEAGNAPRTAEAGGAAGTTEAGSAARTTEAGNEAGTTEAGSAARTTQADSAAAGTHKSGAPSPLAPRSPPRPAKILYSKQVQTDEPLLEPAPPSPTPSPSALLSPRVPQRTPTPPSEELGKEYADFVYSRSLVIERVLDEEYDVLTDYTTVPDAQAPDHATTLHHVHTLFDTTMETRAVTALDWSAMHPELLAAAYSHASVPSNNGLEGLVAVWNRHVKERPEFLFAAPTDVTAVLASPFHPNLFLGGAANGQILVWDTRNRRLPVQRTPLSFSAGAGTGHCAPVTSLCMTGSAQAHTLVSASLDGLVCTWSMDMLAMPQESILLTNPMHPRSADVGVATLDVPSRDATQFFVGTDEGNVFHAARYDRAGIAAGLDLAHIYVGHAAPVTRLVCHPAPRGRRAPVDFSDLFLTSSMDWSTALWRMAGPATSTQASKSSYHYPHANARIATSTRTNPLAFRSANAAASPWTPVHPMARFENQQDYVMDVRWHPQHPAVFAQADAGGRLEMYNLNTSLERTVQTAQAPAGLNRLAWEHGTESAPSTRIALGALDGRVHLYEVPETLVRVRGDVEWLEMQHVLKGLG
ncbi:hypothetical protein MVES1_002301 [Malassezia vespertilionis]|uniref:Uncharacterized protein n=1 Tax=Malassezia vespertilionis TaxID=2020962 RepID=A0A2N1JBC6_9BASI|nr:uncharacterized protein MVES1_002301 [Malassezia vespertilionis]PKI83860.1 hypothetical protein MVES_002168 [Malassezia vespertilionis]WFD06946.1 hypothetical protein MVES1_002301 [Malassezia vespertilionis]